MSSGQWRSARGLEQLALSLCDRGQLCPAGAGAAQEVTCLRLTALSLRMFSDVTARKVLSVEAAQSSQDQGAGLGRVGALQPSVPQSAHLLTMEDSSFSLTGLLEG